MKLIPQIRQWVYPKEFRIDALDYPLELPLALEQIIDKLSSPIPADPDNVQIGFLADVGTGLWRLRQKMLQPGTEEPLEEMRRAYRHLESTLNTLDRAEIQIQDHTGELLPEFGIPQVKVLAYQPVAGVTHHQVQETIKPTVYFKGKMIQMGEVIVSIPEENSSHS